MSLLAKQVERLAKKYEIPEIISPFEIEEMIIESLNRGSSIATIEKCLKYAKYGSGQSPEEFLKGE